MENPEPELEQEAREEESKEIEREKKESRKRIKQAITIIILLLILLLLPIRVQKAKWYAQNVECLKCHTEMLPKFDEANVHNPFLKERCITCHRRHTSAGPDQSTGRNASRWGEVVENLLPQLVTRDLWNWMLGLAKPKVGGVKAKVGKAGLNAKEENLCIGCHAKTAGQMSRRYPHKPFNEKKCASCHDPHASNFAAITRRRPEDLCLVCHVMGGELKLSSMHPPFEKRSCTSCHTGHASDYKILLKASQRDVCLACHEGVANQLHMAVRHEPFENGECTGCHRPHSSEARFLLVEELPGVCYRCHEQTRADFSLLSHHPASYDFTCVKCHEPHAAGLPTLLFAQANDVCYACHGDIKPSFIATMHSKADFPKGRGACLGCHYYHGSNYDPLLVDEPLALCLRCHKEQLPPKNHPVGGESYDARRDSRLTCTSTCHWIHYVPQRALLKWEEDELCLVCHAGVGIWY